MPRYIGVSMLDGSKDRYLVAVKSKNYPGALGELTTRMGKAGLNILVTNDCSPPEGDSFTFSFIVESKDPKLDEEAIRKSLMSSPHAIDSHVRRSGSKILVDDFAFPLMYFPSGRGILLPQSGVTAMFQDLTRMFGTGGESIIFRAGHAVGTQGTEDLAKALGEDQLEKYALDLTGLYSALGWGKMEVLDISDDMKTHRLKLTHGFESDGVKTAKPNCHFTRGLIAGSTERIFGGPVVCAEEKCAATGAPYCVFAVTFKEPPSRSGSS